MSKHLETRRPFHAGDTEYAEKNRDPGSRRSAVAHGKVRIPGISSML